MADEEQASFYDLLLNDCEDFLSVTNEEHASFYDSMLNDWEHFFCL